MYAFYFEIFLLEKTKILILSVLTGKTNVQFVISSVKLKSLGTDVFQNSDFFAFFTFLVPVPDICFAMLFI